MSGRLKRSLFQAAEATGLLVLLRHLKPGPTILFYHGVEEQLTDPRVQSLHLPLEFFERQLDYLQKHFEIVSLGELYGSLGSRRKLDRRQVVLTFDDGYRNNLTVVAPLLKARGMPFTVFVSTRHITEGHRFPTYVLRTSIFYTRQRQARVLGQVYDTGTEGGRRATLAALSRKMKCAPQPTVEAMLGDLDALLPTEQWAELNDRFSSDQPMTWDEVRALHDGGVQIGSHCHDHFLLHSAQAAPDLLAQLRSSRELIRQHVGDCRYIAYPNGTRADICPQAVEMAREEGFRLGLTTIPGQVQHGADPMMLPRVSASTGSIDRFRYAVSASFRGRRPN